MQRNTAVMAKELCAILFHVVAQFKCVKLLSNNVYRIAYKCKFVHTKRAYLSFYCVTGFQV